jgi:lysyl-tRNA synthetase class 2
MPIDEIRDTKINKVAELKKMGIDPYPTISKRTHSVAEVLANFDAFVIDKKVVILAGRIMATREHGGSVFLDLYDGGSKIQAYVKKDIIGEPEFEKFQKFIDIGDFIEVKGLLFKTKKDEKTVETESFTLLSKAILPLPEKWHGLQDVEERYRKRYLDLLFNEDVRDKMTKRFKILDLVRQFYKKHDFIEVETPILQPIPGGATARPFKTFMNDLKMDMYLRVAPELYLKRLLVGGFERVFEIAKNFRNEGMDREHNPEFDMVEAYAAYKDYNWMMDLTEDLMIFLAEELNGKPEITYNGQTIKLRKPFVRVEFNEIVKNYCSLDYDIASEEDFIKKAEELNIKIDKAMSKANIADEIFKKLARPKMIDPVFVINHPIELSPLTKKVPGNPGHVERFQLLIGGFESNNAFTELNDPLDQAERFGAQEKMRAKGNEEAQRMDQDFVDALEHGMPPAAGIGIGIDRLVALYTDSHSLREIILFPTMKNK